MRVTFCSILVKKRKEKEKKKEINNVLPCNKCFTIELKIALQAPGIPTGIWELHSDTSGCIPQGI